MKRKSIVIMLLLFALIFTSTACTASQLNTGKVKTIEKQDSRVATDSEEDKVEDKNTHKDKNTEKANTTEKYSLNRKFLNTCEVVE